MFSLEPPFTVVRCEPATTAFGGVAYSLKDLCKPYSPQELTSEMKAVMESVGESLKRAYEVKTVIEASSNSLSTVVRPIEAKLDRGIFFDLRRYNKMHRKRSELLLKVESVCDRMLQEGKDNAVLTREDNSGFYFFHNLKKNFDPESAGYLLETIENLMLRTTANNFSVKREIKPDCLRVDVKLGAPKSSGYVV
jgi:hypothetical protein